MIRTSYYFSWKIHWFYLYINEYRFGYYFSGEKYVGNFYLEIGLGIVKLINQHIKRGEKSYISYHDASYTKHIVKLKIGGWSKTKINVSSDYAKRIPKKNFGPRA